MDWIQLIEIISSVAIVVVTVGLLVSTNRYRKATEEMAKIQQKNTDSLKRDNALELIHRWDDPSLLRARRFTRDIGERRTSLSDEELFEQIEGDQADKELKESLIHVFNFWESVRYSITFDRADEDILKEAFESVYISMYDRFKVWLDRQPHSYRSDLEKLYNRWKSAS